jgi:hypothetical protein
MSKWLNGKSALLASLVMLASSNVFADGNGWAAIVVNAQTGSWGAAHGAASRFDAETSALSFCGADCAGIDAYDLESGQSGLHETYTQNGWVAYARGTGHWGASGQHDSQSDAEYSAYNNCGGDANGCQVVRSLSSYSYAQDIDGTNINNQ